MTLFFQELDGSVVDIHTKIAMILFDVSAETAKADTAAGGDMRQCGKRFAYGFVYNNSIAALCRHVGTAIREERVTAALEFLDAELCK